MAKAGRPRIQIDLANVEQYAQVCDSEEQIVRALGISYNTLQRRKAEIGDFREAIKRGRAKADVFVGGKLMEKIKAGDTASTIFYLKARCGWRETQKIEADVITREEPPEGLVEIYAKLRAKK